MDVPTRYRATNVVLFVAALAHALATWPLTAVAGLFGGGIAVAFVAELAVVRARLLDHNVGRRVAGVPVYVLLGWPAVVYAVLRVSLLALPPGPTAAAGAAVLATAGDVVADPRGVTDGAWSYPDHPLSRPRYRGVPWWNFAGWLAVAFAVAMTPAMLG
ncbi:MAG: carotenoid biosynthesis protein [Halobacteriales archaeon]